MNLWTKGTSVIAQLCGVRGRRTLTQEGKKEGINCCFTHRLLYREYFNVHKTLETKRRGNNTPKVNEMERRQEKGDMMRGEINVLEIVTR